MLELLIQRRACPACGASMQGPRDGGDVRLEQRGGAFLRGSYVGGRVRVPAERSGLAYAAGFAGVLYLFRYSLAPLVMSQAGYEWGFAAGLIRVWSLLAPVALALSFAAALSLDRSPRTSGRAPALFGFFVGWFGVVAWLSQLDERWLRALVKF